MFAGFSVGNIVRMDRCAVHIFRQLAQTASYMMPVIPAMALLTGNFYESGRKINTQPGLCTVDIRNNRGADSGCRVSLRIRPQYASIG